MSDFDADLEPVADRLRKEQPHPAPRFRGELARWLRSEHAPGRPPRLALLVGGCLGGGLVLLLIAAIGLSGSGPLG